MGYLGVTIPLPLGTQGAFGWLNPEQVPPGGLVRAKNIRYTGSVLMKAGGLGSFDAAGIAGAPVVLGGFDYQPSEGVQRIITAANDGKIYKEVSGNLDSVTLVTGLTFTGPVMMLQAAENTVGGARKAFMFSEGLAPLVVSADGSSMTALTLIPSDWTGGTQPLGVIYHDGRLYAWLQHSVYPSSVIDHTDFQNTDPYFQVAPGFGRYISALHSLAPGQLLVGKYPKGMYVVDTSNITYGFNPVQTISGDVAPAGPAAVATVEGDVWFIGSNGHVYSLSAVANNANPERANITARFGWTQWIQDNVNVTQGRIKFVRLLYDATRKEVWAIYTSKTGTRNSIGLVFNLEADSATPNIASVRMSTEERGTYFEGLWLRQETTGLYEVFCGGTGGQVYRANQGSVSIGGATAYDGTFKLPETDFGWYDPKLKSVEKEFGDLTLKILPTGAYNLSVTFTIDGAQYGGARTISLGSTGSALDTGRLTTDFVLGGSSEILHRIPIGGFGQTLGMELSNAGLNQGFEILEMSIGMLPLEEREEE